MAKIIKNNTSRDTTVFDVAYLSDLSAVSSDVSAKIDLLRQALGGADWVLSSALDFSEATGPLTAEDETPDNAVDAILKLDRYLGYTMDSVNTLADLVGSVEDHESRIGAIETSLEADEQSLAQLAEISEYTVGSVTMIMGSIDSIEAGFGQYYDPESETWSFGTEDYYLSSATDLSEALHNLNDGIEAVQTAGVVTLSARATAETGYATTYDLHQGGVLKGSINIPKDFLVKSAALSTVTTADVPYTGARVGDKYIDFVINAKDASATAEHIYLPVNDLVDVYTAQANATQVQLAIDANNVISATIVAGSVGTTELANGAVTTAKIANRAVNSDKIGLVDSTTNKLYTLQVASGRLQLAEIAAD